MLAVHYIDECCIFFRAIIRDERFLANVVPDDLLRQNLETTKVFVKLLMTWLQCTCHPILLFSASLSRRSIILLRTRCHGLLMPPLRERFMRKLTLPERFHSSLSKVSLSQLSWTEPYSYLFLRRWRCHFLWGLLSQKLRIGMRRADEHDCTWFAAALKTLISSILPVIFGNNLCLLG